MYQPLGRLLRLGDDCRLLAPHAGLDPGAFLTVSGAPYRSDPDSYWVECEYGIALEPQWDEFPVSELQPLCAACTDDAATRNHEGALLCARCDDEHQNGWQDGDL